MLTICLKENYNIFFNSKKNKFCTIINYNKIMLILCLTNIDILINISIVKKSKVVVYNFIFYLY